MVITQYLRSLKKYNQHTNLVGKSTLIDPWERHILDSLQLIKHIKNKKLSIIDMGSGAGIPGIILSIMGYENVTLVDSNQKKINFLKILKKSLNLNVNIYLGRLENFNNLKFDVITSRALANLNQLISYSQKFIKKNSVLVFLKGKTVNDEIHDAKKNWFFQLKKYQSISDSRGCVLTLKKIKKND